MPNMLLEQKSSQLENKGESKQAITSTIKQIQIPLTGTTWAIVQVPVPMSEENWKEMQDFLALMKKPITGSSSPTKVG